MRNVLEKAEPISDNELLRRHLEGDDESFGILMNRYRRELYNFLFRFMGDAALAEDVFQETFLQVHTSAAAFDQSRTFKPWLFTIAANKGRDAMRSRQRRQTAPLDATIAGDTEGRTSYADIMPADIPPPDFSLLNTETRQAVEKIMSQMPEGLRVVLLLSYFDELPYKEIAEILNVPLGTVKSRLHAAVRYFARQWKAVAKRLGHEQQTK
ncbi:MAG: sigma-70 family RNA polymerase sigma factor [Planctomycetes bacterium]|nr:sigma-70 family RNA polymerase sigma factor [Planctomycetota bacterium]